VSDSLQPASIRTSASSSPRVGPRLTITTGMPRLRACRTNRKPDITARDDPATRSAPSSSAASSEPVGGGELRVAVGGGLDGVARRLDEARVGRHEPSLQIGAGTPPSAGGADDVGDAPVQVDQGPAARGGV
jgi:hypothetical protein